MLRGHPAAALLAESDAALQALRGLLDRLLTVSRLEAGIDSVKPVTFALDGVIAPLVSEYRGRAAEKALDLRWVPCGLTAVSDPLMFAAILRNLIDNAIRYTPGSGQVLIGCRRLGDSVRVEVYNSGAGIPDEKIEAVFEDFVQLDNPARNSGLGYGFGLAIVRRLCDRLDHPILVTSRAGRGTCFRVTVPRGGVVPPVTPENPAEDRRALRRLVLLVDDDVLVLRSLARSLVQAGFEAVAAPSGRAALAALGGRKPDIALLDYRLGDETGLDVLAELDAAFGRGIPVCLLSGDTGVELPDEIARRGVGVLYKPIGSRDLLSVVRAMGVAVVP